jgi:hypothetical protein
VYGDGYSGGDAGGETEEATEGGVWEFAGAFLEGEAEELT